MGFMGKLNHYFIIVLLAGIVFSNCNKEHNTSPNDFDKCNTITGKGIKLDSIKTVASECGKSNGQIHFFNLKAKAPVKLILKLDNIEIYNADYQSSISDLNAGFYSIKISDSNGCTYYKTIELKNDCPCDVKLKIIAPSVLCEGSSMSSAVLSAEANNGLAPYIYSWSSGLGTGQSKAVSPSISSTYCVTVVDANKCSAKACHLINLEKNPNLIYKTDCIYKGIKIFTDDPREADYTVQFFYGRKNLPTKTISLLDIVLDDKKNIDVAISTMNCNWNSSVALCYYSNADILIETNNTSCTSCKDGFFEIQRLKTNPCDTASTNYQFEIYKENDFINLIQQNTIKQLEKGIYEIYYVNGDGCYLFGTKKEIL
jgi:hypothetical protein